MTLNFTTIFIAAAGWAISAYVGYAAAMSNLNVRVAVLESSRPEVERRLTSIETKIDVLLGRG